MYTLKGSIKKIKETRNVSDTFKVREFVIEDNTGQYPQIIAFQSAQDRCEMLDNFEIGQDVEVFFNLRGREWTSPTGDERVFNIFGRVESYGTKRRGTTDNNGNSKRGTSGRPSVLIITPSVLNRRLFLTNIKF